MDITVPIQIKVHLPAWKKFSVGSVAAAVRELALNQKVTEAIIQEADEKQVERYCGEKHDRGNGKHQYPRAGSIERHPVTAVGRLTLTLHRVKDTVARRIFVPVEECIEFQGKRIYLEDISMISAGLATKMTHRDAVKEGKQFIPDFPSACTINRRVIEDGERIKAFHGEMMNDARIAVAFADGTKTHSQERGRSKNEVRGY